MEHGTFEITLYPSVADLARTPWSLPTLTSYPVTAMFRPSACLSAQRAGGEFTFDLNRLLEVSVGDPRNYGLALGQGLFRGEIRDLFRHALAATPTDDSLHILLALETEVDYLASCRGVEKWSRVRKRVGLAAVIVIPLGIVAGLYKYAEDQRNARETTELTAAQGLFRPLVREPGNLNEREVEALLQLGSLKPDQEGVRLKFFEHTLSDVSRRCVTARLDRPSSARSKLPMARRSRPTGS